MIAQAVGMEIVRLYLLGYSIRQVCTKLEVKRWQVADLIKGVGVSRRYTRRKIRQKIAKRNRLALRNWQPEMPALSSIEKLEGVL